MWCPYKDLWPSRQGIVQVGIKHGYGTPTPIRSLQILRHIIYLPTKGSWNTSSFCQGAMRPAGCSLESSNELKLNRSAWAISELQTNRTVRGQVKPSEFEAGRLVVTVHSVSSTASQAKSACLVFSYSGDNKHCLVNGYRLLLVLLFIGQNLQTKVNGEMITIFNILIHKASTQWTTHHHLSYLHAIPNIMCIFVFKHILLLVPYLFNIK